jgi:hypothetical protein
MIKKLSVEDLAKGSLLELLHLAFDDNVPKSLVGLSRPSSHLVQLAGYSLNRYERKLAGLMLSFIHRINLLEEGHLVVNGDRSELLGQLDRQVALLDSLLYETLETRVEYNRSFFKHLEVGDDGNIYACSGGCNDCKIIAEVLEKNTYKVDAENAYLYH